MSSLPLQCPNCGGTEAVFDDMIVDGVIVRAHCKTCGAEWDRRKGWRDLQRLPRKQEEGLVALNAIAAETPYQIDSHDETMRTLALADAWGVNPLNYKRHVTQGLALLLRARGIPAKKAAAIARFLWKNGVVIA